jgi:hypothetical protein
MAVGTFIGDASKWQDGERNGDADYRITYEGAVLQTYERNGSWDSDFYAIVYDAESDTIKHVQYATTRGWTYPNYATVDATDEVLVKAQVAMRRADVSMGLLSAEWASKEHAKGKRVSVIGTGEKQDRPRRWKGEVIEAGSEGTTFWMGVDSYRTPRYAAKYGHRLSYRLGVELDDGRKVFGPDDAFEVVDPEQYVPSREQVEATMPSPERLTNFHRGVPGILNMVG